MTALTLHDIRTIATRLKRRSPDLATEIDALARAAAGNRKVQYVEVTYTDGRTEIMPAEEYQRLTATDLAHSNLRVLSDREVSRLGG